MVEDISQRFVLELRQFSTVSCLAQVEKENSGLSQFYNSDPKLDRSGINFGDFLSSVKFNFHESDLKA